MRKGSYNPVEDNHVAHYFFANLLPEADSRRRICREKKISEDNDFALLKAIGGECAGAFSIVAETPHEIDAGYRHLSGKELSQLLISRNVSTVVGKDVNPPRFSLAGAQNKTRYGD